MIIINVLYIRWRWRCSANDDFGRLLRHLLVKHSVLMSFSLFWLVTVWMGRTNGERLFCLLTSFECIMLMRIICEYTSPASATAINSNTKSHNWQRVEIFRVDEMKKIVSSLLSVESSSDQATVLFVFTSDSIRIIEIRISDGCCSV